MYLPVLYGSCCGSGLKFGQAASILSYAPLDPRSLKYVLSGLEIHKLHQGSGLKLEFYVYQ